MTVYGVADKKRMNHFNNPINIYEVHAPSWKEHEDGSLYTFKDLTVELIPYVKRWVTLILNLCH